jgi:hypothetical protein
MRLRSARRDHLEVVVRVAQLPNAQHEPSSLPFTVRESRLMT